MALTREREPEELRILWTDVWRAVRDLGRGGADRRFARLSEGGSQRVISADNDLIEPVRGAIFSAYDQPQPLFPGR